MDIIRHVSQPVVQSQYPDHSWHVFCDLAFVCEDQSTGTCTSADDLSSHCPRTKGFLNVFILRILFVISDSTINLRVFSVQLRLNSRRSTRTGNIGIWLYNFLTIV